MKKNTEIVLFVVGVLLISCKGNDKKSFRNSESNTIQVREIELGGQRASAFTLKNQTGMEVELLSFGAILSKILIPDRNGIFENILLTYSKPSDFYTDKNFFGATAGRYANRIADGRFELDGETYELATNNSPNHLHGGTEGFNKKFWEATIVSDGDEPSVRMTYTSPDGEEGYPGTLQTALLFTLRKDNSLTLEFEAKTDKPTIVNLTHHGYFNLSGMSENVLNHNVEIFAEHYLPVDESLIPTGEVQKVENTPFDFRYSKKIGEQIAETGKGYDHNFVVKDNADGKLERMAKVIHSETGRTMELYSTKPGVQFYTGNNLDGSQVTEGIAYDKYFGFCLEPQYFPDSPNQSAFPSSRLNPGDTYRHTIKYKFGVTD